LGLGTHSFLYLSRFYCFSSLRPLHKCRVSSNFLL
jgi:hypothetical protein